MMKNMFRGLWGAGLVVLTLASSAAAVDVQFDGVATSVFDYSDSGADVGNEGYWFANFDRGVGVNDVPADDNAVDALPTYVSVSYGDTVDSAGGWSGYDTLTLPDGNSGVSGALELNSTAGGGGPGPGLAGDQLEYFTLTFADGTPRNLFLGLVADNSDGAIFSNLELLVNGASTGAMVNDLDNDLYTFALSNINPGDTVQVDGILSTDGTVSHLGGFVLDRIPEPSSVAIASVASFLFFGVYGANSRRRKAASPVSL